ncbi:hypothetical protein GCM10029964_111480 [Kibdelosporangium lantanae]
MFADRVCESGCCDADLRLCRLDSGCRAAGDVLRAAQLRPLRRTRAPAHRPRGWEVVRHDGAFAAPEPSHDDLTALAEAVREAGRPDRPVETPDPGSANGRRGHLRVLPDPVVE